MAHLEHSSTLATLVTADPGLPNPNPTESYWLNKPHPLANVQSSKLTEATDVVIIGSGITGCSVALHTLQGNPNARVTVLEARSLCSGATGRNGGHVITYGAIMYSQMKRMLGKDEAHKTINFTFQNVNEVMEAAQTYGDESAEFRRVTRIRCFETEDDLSTAKESVAEFEKDFPSESGRYEFISSEEAIEKHGIHGVAGAVLFSAGAIWPYRFIMKLWQFMLNTYPERLSIEANTPASHITIKGDSSDTLSYEIQTPRGTIRADKVVHATNAHTGHLLPALRGLIYPFRSSMTVQDLGQEVPNRGNQNTWSINRDPVPSPESGRTETGSLYLQQNGISGHFFFGGEKPTPDEAITADDGDLSAESTQYLQSKLAALFGQQQSEKNKLVSEWTGIQGFTADGAPLIGRLPTSLSGRDGATEWIVAGFNGGGMAFCWLAGKAIAAMMRKEDISTWFPDVFYPSEARLGTSLSVGASIAAMQEMFPAA